MLTQYSDLYFPIILKDEAINNNLHHEFYQIKERFGDQVELFVQLMPRIPGQQIVNIKAVGDSPGIYIGNQTNYEVLVKIVCSN